MYEYNVDLIKKDSEFKYYFVGLISADGYISKDSNRIELVLAEKDIELLRLVRDYICPEMPIRKKIISSKYIAYRLQIDNSEIKSEIMNYVNTTNKSSSLIFPYGIPDRYVRHYIRGYSDGDGNISVKRGQRKFDDGIHYYYGLRYRVLGTRSFLQGLAINLRRLCNINHESHPHKKGQENVYYIEYGFSVAEKILDYIYKDATYYLHRKADVFNHIRSLDSDTLANNYGTVNGHYNTHGLPDNGSEDIVDAHSNM